ncbi:MAG: NAD(P)H-dependent glycerol-3-phosphate dehydrogenase [Clostridia bacterium]|nr:NAD(P)H-dependent glycerol-3-phosphate dehydrogenase [Clostridia bacterium]
MSSIGVLGAGTWGMALARMLCNSGHEVMVWSAIESEIDGMEQTHAHPNLKGMVIPEGIRFTKQLPEVCQDKDILLFAVPSVFVRSTAAKADPYIREGQIIVDVAKGIEPDSLLTMSQVIASALTKPVKVVALSGPTHAEEVARDLPTTIVSACEDLAVAEYVQDVFMNTCMRVYTNTDVMGVEICGALKNIIALASGISYGLGNGDNAKAALITRGMAEISRLCRKIGCQERTVFGLAGIGDVIVTATSMHSRNNRCGMLIGQGVKAAEAIRQVGMVVEGINAIPAALELAEKYQVEIPLIAAVDAVVNHDADPAATVQKLMARDKRNELDYSFYEVPAQ